MKRALNSLIVLVALVFTVQAMATIITSETTTSDTTNPKFPYVRERGKTYGSLDAKLMATEVNPDLYEIVTLRFECTPKVEVPKGTISFRIPKGMKVISGDTLWTGTIAKGETVVREIAVMPVERGYFFVRGGFVFFDGYFTRGGKRYSTMGSASRIIKIKVKGTPDPRVKALKEAIEELKEELKEVEEGKAPKDTTGHPPGTRLGPPLLNVAPRLDDKGMEVAPGDSVVQDSLSVLLDSLRQEYLRLWEELYKKKAPGIGKPLKLNESSPKGSYDLQAVGEGKTKRTQFLKS